MRNKTDKGFELRYWRLSYRRKFIRALWIAPAVLLFLLFPAEYAILGIPRNDLIVVVLVLAAIQAAFNYHKWKQEERSANNTDDG